MPQSLHVLSAHIVFSTKARQPWLAKDLQEEHHRKETFQEELLRILEKYGAEYDERYLWD